MRHCLLLPTLLVALVLALGVLLATAPVVQSASQPETSPSLIEPAPAFESWWVKNYARTQLWSGMDAGAISFGWVPRWSSFQVALPQQGSRLYVHDPRNGNYAYIDASAVGPVSPTPLSQFRVGVQAGHWKAAEQPAELAGLRRSTGTAGKGWTEVAVNIDVANRVAALLRAAGIQVDVLPATVPIGYKADAFVAIHGDGNSNTSLSGYKLARARWSRIPQKEDALLQAISEEYRAATGLREHPGSITENMRQYYAFNYRVLQHAVDPCTPSVILETAFLTTPSDRKLLLENPERAAEGTAKGIMRFLSTQ